MAEITWNDFEQVEIRVGTVLEPVPGIYGISNAREWIYIGWSDNIQRSLIEHLDEQATRLAGRVPSGFVFEVCSPERQRTRCEHLIREYRPICN